MALGEFDLIRRYFTSLGVAEGVALGVGDDGAVLDIPPGHQLVSVMDTLVAGVHFPEDTAPFDIGYRALAVNLSDLAAMGAEPRWFTLALTLPKADEAWLAGFAAGLRSLAERFGIALVGGDTTRGPLTITVQAEGLVPRGQVLKRSGARPGDGIYVTGTLGDAAAGLALHQGRLQADGDTAAFLRSRFFRPEPRVQTGLALRGLATACIDVSDGLLQDLGHVLAASGVGAKLDVDRLPLSAALDVLPRQEAVKLALSAGDDYELCFTRPDDRGPVLRTGAVITRVGEIIQASGLYLESAAEFNAAFVSKGWQHFD